MHISITVPDGKSEPYSVPDPGRIIASSMSTHTLLLELGVEEFPAGFIPAGLRQMASRMEAFLKEQRLAYTSIQPVGTPRRLALLVHGIPDRQKTWESWVQGPPAHVARKNGEWTQAAIGFARKWGISVDDLEIHETERGSYVRARVQQGGTSASILLARGVREVLEGLRFPRTMRWNGKTRFPRPIRWLVVMLDREILPVSFAGLQAGSVTYGHRLIHPDPLTIEHATTYLDTLLQAGVVVDPESRMKRLESRIRALAGEAGGVLVEDRELLEENTFLMEYPEALLGSFDETFLTLPDVVISTALKQHQRYFSLQDPNGTLLPRFVAPLNNRAETADAVRPGMERVVRARLEDALFYYQEDMQIPLDERVDLLKGIVWVEGLGTLYDKTQRMLNLVEDLLMNIPGVNPETVRTAARLAKTDQTTLMIRDGKEFTKLEGRIGMEYALRQGYPEPVARAIYEHLLPRAPGDPLPGSAEGALIGVADRLDTLAGLFHNGERPSGSEDPFGLRRVAATLLDLLFGFRFPVDLENLLSRALQAFHATDETGEALIHFMEERLERYLEEREHIRYDLVDAVLVHGLSSILDVYERARALQHLLDTDPEQFQMMAVGQKRLANILKDLDDPGEVDPSRFQEEAEKVLHETLMQTRPALERALSRREYPRVLALLGELRPVIDRFFDDVFVMVKDPEIRRNRLALLKEVRSLFLSFADFSRIVVSGATDT